MKSGNEPIRINYIFTGILFVAFTLLTYFVSGNIFFWDTVQLGSKHAHFFFEQEKFSVLLPDSMNSGHIPAFGFYLSICWKIFGKSLEVSHFAMLPFLFGIVVQLQNILSRFLSKEYTILGVLVVLADPTFLGQAVLITPDIPLLFFFLWGLNAIFSKNRMILSLAITGLFLISMRGMMAAFAILLLDVFFEKRTYYKQLFPALFKKSLAYLPAVIIFASFFIHHYEAKGWVGYHTDSPWAPAFERVDLKGFIYNIGILGWRLLDFGRVFLWLIAGVLMLVGGRKIWRKERGKELIFIWLSVTICLSISLLMYKGLSGHRYLLPSMVMFSILTLYLISELSTSIRQRNILTLICFLGLATGNLWIYPEKISQGWDSTLAHLPYYQLRADMMEYLDAEGIGVDEVGTAFPNLTEFKYMELSDDMSVHARKNLDENPYILYSNVYNDFSDEEIDRLNSEFLLVWEEERGGVFMKLLKKLGG